MKKKRKILCFVLSLFEKSGCSILVELFLLNGQNKRYFLISTALMALVLPFSAFAASEGFPAKEIGIQIFNFSIFFGIIIFLMRKPIKVFFHKRQEEFFSFERQAVQLEKEKQKELKTWEKKLEALKEQEEGIQQKAHTEGEKFVFQKKEELKHLKSRLKKEADFFLQLERKKSKNDLLERWKEKVTDQAALELKKQAQSADFQQERFKDFFKQLEVRL